MTHKMLPDNELDLRIVRELSRLAAFGPSRGFAGRVMAQVAMPKPRAVVLFQRARSWLSEPRRALTLAGAYVAVASIALVLTVPRLLENIPALQFGAQWLAARGGDVARDLSLAAASWWMSSGLAEATSAVPRSGPLLWTGLASIVILYAGCAVGLHFLLRTPKVTHAPVQLTA